MNKTDVGGMPAVRSSPKLPVLIAAGWCAVILCLYLVRHSGLDKILLFFQMLASALVAFSTGPYLAEFWKHRALDFGWCAAVLLTALGVGSVLIQRWVREYDLLAGVFSIAAGLWVMAVVILIVGFSTVGRVGWVFGLAVFWAFPPPRKFLKRIHWNSEDGWTRLVLAVLFVALVINFLGACTPPFEFDELEYHLGAPAEYIRTGRITFLPHNFYSNLPQLTEMLYLLALETRSNIAPKMLHCCFGVLSALAIYAVAERLWSRRIAVTAAALFYCLPYVQDLSQTGRIDLATTFFGTLALGGVLLAYDGDRWVWLAALATGAAVATKWTAVAVVAIPVFALLLVTRRSLRLAAVFLVVAALGITPWLIKNTKLTGNPVYPLLNHVWPNPNWSDQQSALFAEKHYAKFADGGGKDLWEKIERYSFDEPGASPILLMTVPLVLLAWKGRVRRVGLLFAAAYAGWFFLTFRPWRFLMPALTLAAALGAVALEAAGKWCRLLVVIAWVSGFCWMGLMIVVDPNTAPEPPQTAIVNLLSGQISERDFLIEMGHGAFEPIIWMNENLPTNAVVLYVGETRTALAKNKVVWSSAFDRPPVQSFEDLRERGITHVYMNYSEYGRLNKNYGYWKGRNDFRNELFYLKRIHESYRRSGTAQSPIVESLVLEVP